MRNLHEQVTAVVGDTAADDRLRPEAVAEDFLLGAAGNGAVIDARSFLHPREVDRLLVVSN